MRLSRSMAVAAVVLGYEGIACSVLTSTDGLTGGESPRLIDVKDAGAGPSVDGDAPVTLPDGALSPRDARAESGHDAGAGTVADAAVADVRVADVSTADTARPPTAFTDDFEGNTPLPRAWDVENSLGGTLAIDPLVYRSPQNSFSVTSLALAATAPPNAVNANLQKRFPMPGPGLTAHYEFSAYFRQYDTNNGADCVIAALQTSDGYGDLAELQIDTRLSGSNTMQAIFAEYTGYGDGGSVYVAHPTSVDLKLGAWNRIAIELRQSQPPVARVFFDGVEVVAPVNIVVTVPGPTQQISLGLSYVRPRSGAWIVDYDDVSYDVRSTP